MIQALSLVFLELDTNANHSYRIFFKNIISSGNKLRAGDLGGEGSRFLFEAASLLCLCPQLGGQGSILQSHLLLHNIGDRTENEKYPYVFSADNLPSFANCQNKKGCIKIKLNNTKHIFPHQRWTNLTTDEVLKSCTVIIYDSDFGS
jgi:hypothetical protein